MFTLADFTLTAATNKLSLYPLSTPRTDAGRIILSDRKDFPGVAGTVTISNLVYGLYDCSIAGRSSISVFRILVPDTNTVLDAVDLLVTTNTIPGGLVGYTAAVADARFIISPIPVPSVPSVLTNSGTVLGWNTNFSTGGGGGGSADLTFTNHYQIASVTLTNLAALGVTNYSAGPGIALAITGGQLWITNLWPTNGFVTAAITNGLASLTYVQANDITTSNAVVALLIANDATGSNALRTAFLNNDITTSNGVVNLLTNSSNANYIPKFNGPSDGQVATNLTVVKKLTSYSNSTFGTTTTNALGFLNISKPISNPFFITYESIDTTTNQAPWTFSQFSAQNSASSRSNYVWTWGYNAIPTGRINPNETRFSWNLETYYEYAGTLWQMEHYINFVKPDGTGFRPWGLTMRTNFSQTDFVTDLVNWNSPTGTNDGFLQVVDASGTKSGVVTLHGDLVVNSNGFGGNVGSMTLNGGVLNIKNNNDTLGVSQRILNGAFTLYDPNASALPITFGQSGIGFGRLTSWQDIYAMGHVFISTNLTVSNTITFHQINGAASIITSGDLDSGFGSTSGDPTIVRDGTPYMRINANQVSFGTRIGLGPDSGSPDSFFTVVGLGAVNFKTNFFVTGNVGIGTTNPLAKLHDTNSTAQVAFRVDQQSTLSNSISVVNFGNNPVLTVETNGIRLANSTAVLTNTLYASATLDFPSTLAGAVSDLPITVTGASDGDVVFLGVPSGSITAITGDYYAWASNGVVFVRYANNNLVNAQDPASGTFKVQVNKFQ